MVAILADKSREKSVRNITLPTLIIHGERDPLIPFKEGLSTHKLINSSTFVPVKEMGHLLTQKSFDNFDSEIIVHLDSNS